MNSECRKFLHRQLFQKRIVASKNPDKDCPYLFVTGRNSPLNASIYNDAIKRIVADMNAMRIKEEQLPYFSAHCFRHTFATRCFEAGVDAKVVQKFLGHASIKMTMDLYTHVVQDKLLDSIEMIVPGDCGFDSVEIDWSAVGY
jgi:integrase